METREHSIKMANLIFVGDVISFDSKEESYIIKVIEVLKGTVISDTLYGQCQTSCSILPVSGRWLVYCDLNMGGKLDFGECGASRSFDEPEKLMVSEYIDFIPKPPSKLGYLFGTRKAKKQDLIINQEELKAKAKSDLELEITELKQRF